MTRHSDVIIDAFAERAGNIRGVVEITERALAADVAGILAGAERLRAAGIEPESLAVIPLLRPEVVELDLALVLGATLGQGWRWGRGDQGVDRDRELEFLLTYNRALVTASAHTLIGRIGPAVTHATSGTRAGRAGIDPGAVPL